MPKLNIKKYKSFFRNSFLGFTIGYNLARLKIDELLIIKKKIINIIYFIDNNLMYYYFENNSSIIKNYILIIIIFIFLKRLRKINVIKIFL